MRAVFWHTCTFSGYINRLCRHSVELYCVSWIYCPMFVCRHKAWCAGTALRQVERYDQIVTYTHWRQWQRHNLVGGGGESYSSERSIGTMLPLWHRVSQTACRRRRICAHRTYGSAIYAMSSGAQGSGQVRPRNCIRSRVCAWKKSRGGAITVCILSLLFADETNAGHDGAASALLLGVYTFRSSDRQVGPTGRSDDRIV